MTDCLCVKDDPGTLHCLATPMSGAGNQFCSVIRQSSAFDYSGSCGGREGGGKGRGGGRTDREYGINVAYIDKRDNEMVVENK